MKEFRKSSLFLATSIPLILEIYIALFDLMSALNICSIFLLFHELCIDTLHVFLLDEFISFSPSVLFRAKTFSNFISFWLDDLFTLKLEYGGSFDNLMSFNKMRHSIYRNMLISVKYF